VLLFSSSAFAEIVYLPFGALHGSQRLYRLRSSGFYALWFDTLLEGTVQSNSAPQADAREAMHFGRPSQSRAAGRERCRKNGSGGEMSKFEIRHSRESDIETDPSDYAEPSTTLRLCSCLSVPNAWEKKLGALPKDVQLVACERRVLGQLGLSITAVFDAECGEYRHGVNPLRDGRRRVGSCVGRN